MNKKQLRAILKTLNKSATEHHPLAKQGNFHDFIRANDKHLGDKYDHYMIKETLYYVETALTQKKTRAKPTH
jgi:hypothetical protein